MKKTKKDLEFLNKRSVSQAARDNNVKPANALSRIAAGWSVEKACTTPVKVRGAQKKKAAPPVGKKAVVIPPPPKEQMELPLVDDKAREMTPFLFTLLGAAFMGLVFFMLQRA